MKMTHFGLNKENPLWLEKSEDLFVLGGNEAPTSGGKQAQIGLERIQALHEESTQKNLRTLLWDQRCVVRN